MHAVHTAGVVRPAALESAKPLRPPGSSDERRRILAEFCRVYGQQIGAVCPTGSACLSSRQREILQRLLAGDSEKQVAARLTLSRHTVHIHVKKIYRRLNVSSRPELLARCLR